MKIFNRIAIPFLLIAFLRGAWLINYRERAIFDRGYDLIIVSLTGLFLLWYWNWQNK